jgi:hypothetical protein
MHNLKMPHNFFFPPNFQASSRQQNHAIMFVPYGQAHPFVVLRPSRVDIARYGSREGASAS